MHHDALRQSSEIDDDLIVGYVQQACQLHEKIRQISHNQRAVAENLGRVVEVLRAMSSR